MECRSDQKRARNHHAGVALGRDASTLSPAARSTPAKSPATSTCATACWCRRRARSMQIATQMSRRCPTPPRREPRTSGAKRLRCRHWRPVERQYDPGHLHRCVQRPAQRHDRAGRRSLGAAAVEFGDHRSERYRHRRRFFRRHRPRSRRSSIPRLARPGCSFPIRRARSCACSTSGRRHDHRQCGVDDDHRDLARPAAPARCRCSPTARRPIHRRDHRAPAPQSTGYAGRITVNAALIADPSKLVSYQASTPAGDATRPNFIYNQLVNASLAIFAGGRHRRRRLAVPRNAVRLFESDREHAKYRDKCRDQSAIGSGHRRQRPANAVQFNIVGVNIDTEMANLLTLQNAYGANARVMSTVKAMLDTLMQM